MNGSTVLVHITGLGLSACGVIALLAWAASVALRDVSIVDSAWSLLVLAPALVAAALVPQVGPRAPAVLSLAGIWALRLAVYITWRHWGHPEDSRYQAIRARNDRMRTNRIPETATFPPEQEPRVFVCGPTRFVEAVADALVALGHRPGRIRTERFGGA